MTITRLAIIKFPFYFFQLAKAKLKSIFLFMLFGRILFKVDIKVQIKYFFPSRWRGVPRILAEIKPEKPDLDNTSVGTPSDIGKRIFSLIDTPMSFSPSSSQNRNYFN